MSVALNNLIMPASAEASSEKVSSKPKRSASSKADKTANPEAKSAQVGESARKSANSKDAPDTTKKSNAHKGPKAPGGKAVNVKKGEKVVAEAVESDQVFAEIIQSAQASGNPQKVVAGESVIKTDAGNPDVVLAGKAQAEKGAHDSAQVRASILGKTQVAPATNKPVPEGQAMATSEVVGNPIGKDSIGGNAAGEMHIDAEPAALHRKPIEITEALTEAVSSGIGAEKTGESQVGLEASEVNRQVLTSPAGPVIPALAEGMKQVSDAPRVQTPVASEKIAFTASSVTGRKVVSTAGLTPNVSAKADDGTGAGSRIDTLLRGFDAPVAAVGQRQAGHGETSQEVMQHLGTAAEPVRFDVADVPTVSSETSLPAPAANQIVEALQASAARQGQQIVIRLDPPELGKVSISLSVTGDEVRGVLRVENPHTLTQLQREAPALLSRLAEAGVQLRQMDLSLSEQGTGDSSLYSQLRDDSGLWGQNNQGENSQSSASELLSDEPVLVGVEEAGREMTTLADDAINVWI